MVFLKHIMIVVLAYLHDRSGHCGVHNTIMKVKERFYWQGYEEDFESYFQACQPCQMRNSPNGKPQALLGNIKAKYSFYWISWDNRQ